MSSRPTVSEDKQRAEIVARFPAAANQRMHWDEVARDPSDPSLNAAFRRRLSGKVSDEAIAKAMQALIARHEILRTRFVEIDGVLHQHVLERVPFKLDQVDLRRLPDAQREEEALRMSEAAARRPFQFAGDASDAPLFRAMLIRVAADEAYLLLVFHHLVIDGWSLDVVVREIGQLAAAAGAGEAAALPAVAMQFGDFARWQADVTTSEALDGERAYWADKLADLPDFRLPPDRPGDPGGKPSEIRSFLLPTGTSAAFEQQARQAGHTMFSFATAAAAMALRQASGSEEIVLGTQIAGRDDPDAEAIVGPVINTVILRVPTPESAGFAQVAQSARENIREAMANQLLPFAEVQRMVRDAREPDVPAYRVNLVVQRTYISSATVQDTTYGDFTIQSVAAPSVGALWDLSLFMVGRAEGWRLSCEYAPELYDCETIDALLHGWRAAIEDAAGIGGAASDASMPEAARPVINPRIDALKQRILTLQAEGDGAPILAINNASVLYPVARAIGTAHPFHDLQFCPGPTPVDLPRRHFIDHARDAVEMIRLAQPHGPYVLFGLCVMGALAIEAARILQSEGETVELVVLNDSYRPGYRERMGWLDRQQRAWQVRYLTTAKLLKRMRSGELSFAQVMANYRIARALGLPRLAARFSGGPVGPEPDAMVDGSRWFPETVLLPSQADFVPEPYRGRVVMFRSEDVPNGRLFPKDFGWSGYIDGPFEIVECPGTHDTMFRDAGASVIGAVVRRILGEAS
ncbi:condensation domain-containing protein [Altererythrobacter sp. CAU 1778]